MHTLSSAPVVPDKHTNTHGPVFILVLFISIRDYIYIYLYAREGKKTRHDLVDRGTGYVLLNWDWIEKFFRESRRKDRFIFLSDGGGFYDLTPISRCVNAKWAFKSSPALKRKCGRQSRQEGSRSTVIRSMKRIYLSFSSLIYPFRHFAHWKASGRSLQYIANLD